MAENPWLCVKRFFARLALLLNPSSFLIRHVSKNYYTTNPAGEEFRGRLSPLARNAIVWTTVAAYILVSVLATVGLATMPAGRARSLTLLVVFLFCAIYGSTYALTRYRLAILPLLAISAGYALANRSACLARLRTRRTAIAVLVVLVVLCGFWSVHFDKLWRFRLDGVSPY